MNSTGKGEPVVALNELRGRKFAEFFAGIGLVKLALESEGWKSVFANDFDPAKLEIFSQNFNPKDFRLEDIARLQPKHVPNVTLATASFPCTDLSLAGERQGLAGKESGTLWRFLEILEDMGQRRPPLVMLENVTGFLSSNDGEDIRNTIKTLNKLGYRCEILQLNAAMFVPQSRQRIFVIGFPLWLNNEEAGFQFNSEKISPSEARPEMLLRAIRRNSDLSWGHLIRVPQFKKRESSLEDIVEVLPPDAKKWWNKARTKYFFSQMAPSHRKVALTYIKSPKIKHLTAFRRVRHGICRVEIRADGVAGCLRTPRGGSSRQILMEAGCGKYRVRYMTPREYARLQGVPDSFRIDVGENQALFGFGDAICIPIVKWVGKHLLNPLEAAVRRRSLAAIG